MDEFDTIDKLKARVRFLESQLRQHLVAPQDQVPYGGNIRHDLLQLNPQALFSEDHDGALMGYTLNCYMPHRAVYDAERAAELLMASDSMTWTEAFEHLERETFCAYVGDSGPLYLSRGLR
jgi:hypothetical protein